MPESTATESTATRPSTSLEKLVDRLSQPRAVFAMFLLFALFLVCAAYLDGVLAQPFDGLFWRVHLMGPAVTAYLLLVNRFLGRFRDRAIEAFRPLVALDDDGFERLLAEARPLDPRREWLALGTVVVVGLLLMRPWSFSGLLFWMKLYVMATIVLSFGSLGWVIYSVLANTRLFSELHRQPLNIDIFDPTPLEPIARMSLSMSVAFIGVTTLRMLFVQDPEILLRIEGIIVNSTLILVAVLVFFLTMADTHRVMAEAKERKLKLVRRNLRVTFQELEEQTATGQLEGLEALSDSITAWLAYEKRIEEAPEWPYTTDTLRNLVVSTLIPIGAWVAQVIVEFIA
jgi:hypothetical protein